LAGAGPASTRGSKPGSDIRIATSDELRDTRSGVGQTLLVVDDHSGFRACAREVLQAEGFEVVGEAADAASGIAAARELRPDVVLLDVQLPDLDGIQASHQIATPDGKSAIVLTSSRDFTDLAGAIAESPARGFISKSELSGAAVRNLLR
jgi:DNA-binding NarL/FixJ family response regulator